MLPGTYKRTKKWKEKMRVIGINNWKNPEYRKKLIPILKKSHIVLIGNKARHWKGGRLNHNGYVKIYSPNHPYQTNGYVFEHRLVMEKFIGMYLDLKTVVHHINGVKTDNRIENLEMLTKKDHDRLSALKRKRINGRFA